MANGKKHLRMPLAFSPSPLARVLDMAGLQHIGKLLIGIGIICAVLGGVLLLSGKVPWLGRLPGDIIVQRKNFTLYFPLATSIILSVLLTLLFWLIGRR